MADEMIPRRGHPNQRDPFTLPVELQRATVPPPVRAWVARRTGAAIARTRRLAGASSAAMHAVLLSDGRRLVLRRYVWPGFLEDEPVAPRREVDALELGASRSLPVPQVVVADVAGDEVGDGVPTLLMTFMPGRSLADPDVDRLADVAAAVHDTDPGELPHDYFPWYETTSLQPPAASNWPALWERAIELRADAMPPYRPTFVHRDFHPGNVLWRRGRVSAVVDWANACRGPWGCDVAHCRANLLGLCGPEVADRFLAAYESLTGETYHPYWEIASVLENGPSHWTPEIVSESEPRLARAVQAMGTLPPGPG